MSRQPWRDVARAAAAAGVVSGVPSTLHALATGRDVLEPTRAAGTLLLGDEQPTARLVLAAALVHAGLSLGWAAVLAGVLPERGAIAAAVPAGLAIGVLDLVVVGRRFPAIRALPLAPQLADHVAYAVTAAAVLRRRAAARRSARP